MSKSVAQPRCFDLWQACYPQEAMAERLGVARETARDWSKCFGEIGNLAVAQRNHAAHSSDFDVPQKNIWTGHDKTPHGNFPGSTEPRWLACQTQEAIAEQCEITQGRVSQWIETFINFSNGSAQINKPAAHHATDFDVPQKNIWTGHDKTPHLNFPGSTEPRWLDTRLPGHPSLATAEHCSVTQQAVSLWIEKFFKNGNLSKHEKSLSDHATDFDVPQKNIWTGRKQPHGFSHGRSENP